MINTIKHGAAPPKDVSLSIRYLAEFLRKGGSIDSRFSGLDSGARGTRIHRQLQKLGGPGYTPEVPLSISIAEGDFAYHLSGRADGVIETEGRVVVDEIKTVAQPLAAIGENDHPDHWAQGCCYAHILCEKNGLPACGVRLTYFDRESGEVKRFKRRHTAGELAEFVLELLREYERWARHTVEWREKRTASLQGLKFPFEEYREGQRKMAVACYNTFNAGGRLFCCAPTGIGKTLSVLFPALKALGERVGEQIFYLTAKTITRKAAEDAISLLRKREPLAFHSLTLTAKDKICFLEERACLPDACHYAKGYYDRNRDVVYKLVQTGSALTREVVEAAARDNKLCPYELALDLARWCDCVICDYNYLFDPTVHLQRFFEGKGGNYLFLVDEAHNLVDRSREMYSAMLRKSDFFAFKKKLPKAHKWLHQGLKDLNSAFVALRRECEEQDAQVMEKDMLPTSFNKPLARFTAATEAFLEDHRGSEHEKDLLALYFEVLFYQQIAEGYGDNYTTLVYKRGNDVVVKLFCLDPSENLDKSMGLGRASVLFSATLQPLPYYRDTLGGGKEAKLLTLPSPFPPENLGLFVADGVSTKYTAREGSLHAVAGLLAAMVGAKLGNYIAYFPSYSYMRQVLEVLEAAHPNIRTLVQAPGMGEEAREGFLAAFEESCGETLLGFCVMGGIFAEGVDLPGDRLIGTAVVGVGLPQIGPEPDSIRAYYDGKNGHGFEFAYQFPGMNKVLQAAGRVIRTGEDRGVVLLVDSRFGTARYREMFPAHWAHAVRADEKSLPGQLADFWNEGNTARGEDAQSGGKRFTEP